MLKRSPSHSSVRIERSEPSRARKKVELNSASASAIHQLPGITETDVMELIRRRPFRSWENVQTALNWDPDFIAGLQDFGAKVDGQ